MSLFQHANTTDEEKNMGGSGNGSGSSDGDKKQDESGSPSATAPDVTEGSNSTNTDENNNNNNNHGVTDSITENMADSPTDDDVKLTSLQRMLIVLSISCAVFLAALDTTIVTTAVPSMVADLGSSQGYTWIGSAYSLTNAASVPSWGKVSDIWGRKPIFLLAAATFWVGSLASALAPTMPVLIAGRAVQGLGGGGLTVLANIVVTDLFSMSERGVYYGVLGLVWAVAGGIGPVLGGVFTEELSWRWCFWVNLPTTAVASAVLAKVLTLHNPRTPMREGLAAIDWLGSAAIITATVLFLIGLELGGVTRPWDSALVVCLLVFGILAFAAFGLVEWKLAKFPIVPLRLLGRPSNIAVLAVAWCHGSAYVAASYYLPMYFQAVLGFSALMSGALILPYSMGLGFVSSVTGIVIKKTGKYVPVTAVGMALAALGFGLFIDLPFDKDWAKIIMYQLIAGAGVGPNFMAPLLAFQNDMQPRDMASGTSMYSFNRQLSIAVSIVIGGVVFNNGMDSEYPKLLEQLGPELAEKMRGDQAAANVGFVGGLEGEEGDVARMAYLSSIRKMFIMYAALLGAGLLITAGMSKGKALSKQHDPHKTGLKDMAPERRRRRRSGTQQDIEASGERHVIEERSVEKRG